MNILLVEDDYLLGRSTARLIEKAGEKVGEKTGEHRVRLTHKAADILKHCQSGWTEVVLMDIDLPGTFWKEEEVTGVSLARLLKSQPQTVHIPILLLSAYATETEKRRLLSESAADGIYTKPITDTDSFLRLLMQVCHGKGPSWEGHGEGPSWGGHGLTASAS
ncbi:MAG: response regulator [Cyanobacteria bacterium J06634_6]